MIKICAPGRLHITLIDLGNAGYRRNGGIGFSITGFDSCFEFEVSEHICLKNLSTSGYSDEEIICLTENLLRITRDFPGRGIRLLSAKLPPRHFGFGSGTAIALAIIEAYKIINQICLDRHDIVRLSGRGGTSGIGINGYFEGGFIFDGGRKFDEDLPISSDSIKRTSSLPVMFDRREMPDWPIGILIPPSVQSVTLDIENELFRRVVPLTDSEVSETAYHSVFGVYLSIIENNFSSFCRAINSIQRCRWKSSEIALYDNSVNDAIVRLKEIGAEAVGMSSVGPALYFFSEDFEAVFSKAANLFPPESLVRVSGNNIGRSIHYA